MQGKAKGQDSTVSTTGEGVERCERKELQGCSFVLGMVLLGVVIVLRKYLGID